MKNDTSSQDDVRIVKKGDPEYPSRLRELPGMPAVLYVIGRFPDEEAPSVGIIGARKASHYGKRTAEDFGRFLAARGVQIISGMAEGIDSCSQCGALDGNGSSFAVLGQGVDICYPSTSRNLYEMLKTRGGLISENPPGTKPYSWTFPARNRIIAGLSDILIVVEARSRSGSLITVDFALEQGKTVFAVPGRVGDHLSDGCNQLIYDGAGIACSPEVILEELSAISGRSPAYTPPKGTRSSENPGQAPHRDPPYEPAPAGTFLRDSLPEELKRLLAVLTRDDPLEISSIVDMTRIEPQEAASGLTRLVILGLAEETLPGFYLST